MFEGSGRMQPNFSTSPYCDLSYVEYNVIHFVHPRCPKWSFVLLEDVDLSSL